MKRFYRMVSIVVTLFLICLFSISSTMAAPFDDVIKEASALKKSNPEEAIGKLQQFIIANPKESPAAVARVENAIAQIYTLELQQYDKALAVIDAGLKRSDHPDSFFFLASIKCYVLAIAKRYDTTRTYFYQILPEFLEQKPDRITALTDQLVYYYFEFVLGQVGPTDEYAKVFNIVFEKDPRIISSSRIAQKIVEGLLSQPGKEEQALAWAKLHWMTCDFNEQTLNTATALLQKAWLAKEMNSVKGTAFLKALQDDNAPNPLKDIPLPVLDVSKLKQRQASLPAASVKSRIIVHLLLDEKSDAMLLARRMLLDNPVRQGGVAVSEMSRIFKAADLSLVRANALLQYMQTGEGVNPVDEFFKQYPPKNS